MSNTSPEDALYVHLANKGLSNRAIGKMLSVDESTVRRGLAREDYKRHLVPLDLDERFGFNLDKPLTLTDERIAITADWHVPLYDPGYVNHLIETCRTRNVRTLLIGGDFFNFDSLSAYFPKQSDAGLEPELVEGQAIMRVLLESFDKIVYIWGNHDARLHKSLGFAIQFKEAMRLVFGSLGNEALAKIEFSNLDHAWINQSDGRDWYVCHPASYTRMPLSTARQLSAKYNTNVITAHSHHCAVGYAVDGKKIVAEIGGLFDQAKTAYLQRSTTHPTWAQGFAILEQGEPLFVDSPGFRTG